MEDDRRLAARDLLRKGVQHLVSITIHLSGHLKPFSGGEVEVNLPGEFFTVEDALNSLWKRHAALRDRVLTETGDIREHVNIFVGTQNIKRKNGLATILNETEIHIFNAVSGG